MEVRLDNFFLSGFESTNSIDRRFPISVIVTVSSFRPVAFDTVASIFSIASIGAVSFASGRIEPSKLLAQVGDFLH